MGCVLKDKESVNLFRQQGDDSDSIGREDKGIEEQQKEVAAKKAKEEELWAAFKKDTATSSKMVR